MYKIMTKEEVLQKVNDYCSEKSYTKETLTDGFKDKFAEHFAKRFKDVEPDDENAISDMQFALNTAFSGASSIITEKNNVFSTKENEYKNQIAELTKKLGKKQEGKQGVEIPKELQEQIAELKRFKEEEVIKTKRTNILKLAKSNVRKDLHESLNAFAKNIIVDANKSDEEQAKAIVDQFQEVFKSSIGDIKPYTPLQINERDDKVMASLPRLKV